MRPAAGPDSGSFSRRSSDQQHLGGGLAGRHHRVHAFLAGYGKVHDHQIFGGQGLLDHRFDLGLGLGAQADRAVGLGQGDEIGVTSITVEA